MNQQPSRGIDDPLLARLERLAERRAESQPFPPPMSGPVGGGRAVAPADRLTPTPRTKRRHPARSARIGALVASCASTGALSYLFASSNASNAQSAASAGLPTPVATTPLTTASPVATTSPATTVTTAASAVTSATPTTDSVVAATDPATTVPPTTAQSGVFDGVVVDTRYGPVQVQVQISDGSLTEVAVVQYPDGDRKSLRINQRALPTLRQEALTAQSANVDTVSGATYTSDGYAQSLQSALDAARAAGVAV